jgi:hypothetical protein
MDTLTTYVKTLRCVWVGDSVEKRLVHDTCEIVIRESGIYTSSCQDCSAEMLNHVKIPFTWFDLCSLPYQANGVCVYCLRTDVSRSSVFCRMVGFGGLCTSCDKQAEDIRAQFIAKKLLLGAIIMPDLAAAICLIMGSLPASNFFADV